MKNIVSLPFLTVFVAGLFMMGAIVPSIMPGSISPANAQEALPTMPAPIQNLVDEGAQVRYLGRDHGFDGWLTIKNGQEQYFYVPPGGDAFFMGVMFDKTGKLVTVRQVAKLREDGGDLLDALASADEQKAAARDDSFKFKSPSERLFADIENSNWVPLGQSSAPVLYSFIDPQCPHCHEFVKQVREGGYFDNGAVQMRLVPVGFKDETRAQAAFLMATPNAQERWFAHMDGDETALPAKAEINQQGVQRNLAIMQSWEFSVTPMIVYRAKDGTVKIVRGVPKDLANVIGDLG